MKCGYHLCEKETEKKFCSNRCKNKYHVNNRRKKLKVASIIYKGGKCQVCGYNKCFSALEFHHRNRSIKDFTISGVTTCSWDKLKKELDKCDLVCSNCHKEIESKNYDFRYHKIMNSIDFSKDSNEQIADNLVCKQKHDVKTCDLCKRHVTKKSKICKYCYISQYKSNKPSKEWLEQLIYTLPFLEIGKIYGVTDNTVRKWCLFYKIEIPKFPMGYWIGK